MALMVINRPRNLHDHHEGNIASESPGWVAVVTADQSQSAVTLPEPCHWTESRSAAFGSPSGKFLALTVKMPAGRTPSVEMCSGPDQRRRWTTEAVEATRAEQQNHDRAHWKGNRHDHGALVRDDVPAQAGPGHFVQSAQRVLSGRQGTPRAAPCRSPGRRLPMACQWNASALPDLEKA
jgi:hypothetical protein